MKEDNQNFRGKKSKLEGISAEKPSKNLKNKICLLKTSTSSRNCTGKIKFSAVNMQKK